MTIPFSVFIAAYLHADVSIARQRPLYSRARLEYSRVRLERQSPLRLEAVSSHAQNTLPKN
jgi:hypothetical protein